MAKSVQTDGRVQPRNRVSPHRRALVNEPEQNRHHRGLKGHLGQHPPVRAPSRMLRQREAPVLKKRLEYRQFDLYFSAEYIYTMSGRFEKILVKD